MEAEVWSEEYTWLKDMRTGITLQDTTDILKKDTKKVSGRSDTSDILTYSGHSDTKKDT